MKLGQIVATAAATLLLLAGCVSQPPLPETADWQTQQQQLATIERWQLKGKMGYRQADDGGSAWIDWQQRPQQFELRLSGPFGAGATYLRSEPGFTELVQSGREPLVASSATELTGHLFGWQWPVDAMQYWVRGMPSPASEAESLSLTPQGLLATLQQAGWQLEFSRYRQHQQWLLPGKIKGTRLADGGETSFTLAIKSWQIGDE